MVVNGRTLVVLGGDTTTTEESERNLPPVIASRVPVVELEVFAGEQALPSV